MARHYDSDSEPRRGGSYYVNKKYFNGSSEFANMPSKDTMMSYPKQPYYSARQPDDTMMGIDMTARESTSQTSRHISNQK